jgi:Flp pilus assembly protein TadG
MNRAKGGARKLALLPLARDGVTALEFALVAPVAFLLLLGGIEYGRVLHTRSTLQFAVEQAARCAAVDRAKCGNAEAVKAYAASRALGHSIGASNFSSASLPCGRQVSASLEFDLKMPRPLSRTITLTAVSCHPT